MLGLLQILDGPEAGLTFTLPQAGKKLIGRGHGLPIRLSDPQVSRVHCELQVTDGKVVLADAGSAAGTWVNGARITQHVLQEGEIFCVGETHIVFRWSDVDEKNTVKLEE